MDPVYDLPGRPTGLTHEDYFDFESGAGKGFGLALNREFVVVRLADDADPRA